MPMTSTWRLNVKGLGAPMQYFNSVLSRQKMREHCNSILLTIDTVTPGSTSMKVLLLGGHEIVNNEVVALNSTEMIDLSSTRGLSWVAKAPLNLPRYNSNSVILPDKRIFVIGGTQGANLRENAVTIPEMYDPYAANGVGTSTMLKAHTYTRMYHSTAVLTPDATVLISGGEVPYTLGDGNKNLEVYSPDYLFIDPITFPRPRILTDVSNISYTVDFSIDVTETIISVMLIRFGCPTHGFDQDQRAIELKFRPVHGSNTTLNITPPANHNIAPTGKYMLFVLRNGTDPDGKTVKIPSIAIIVNLVDAV